MNNPIEDQGMADPYVPPRSALTDDGHHPDGHAIDATEDELPGFWRRTFARLIDMVGHYLVAGLAGLIAGIVLAVLQEAGAVAPGWEARFEETGFVSSLIGIAVLVGYNTITEAIGGAGFGKLVLGIRVLNEDGTPCSPGPALIRAATVLIDGLLFGIVAAVSMYDNPIRQRLGDKWGHARVVYAHQVPAASQRSGASVFVGLVLATVAAVGVQVAWWLSVA